MTDIRVFKLDEFRKGTWTLAFTETGGTTTYFGKEGTVEIPYTPNSLMLFDDLGTIVGPVTVDGARALAERIIEGDQRAITDSRALLTLAVAITGFLFYSDEPDPVESSVQVVDLPPLVTTHAEHAHA